jgi:glycosyltransferase involved in cell wall biosynthesis
VVKNNDIAGLTQTLQELINKKELRKYLGQNASSIKDRLSAERVGALFADFIFF